MYMFLALLSGASAASRPPAPVPPCTVEMLKQRPAGDKSWPAACTTLGTANELELNRARLSYGDYEDARFIGEGAIKLDGTGLANADLSLPLAPASPSPPPSPSPPACVDKDAEFCHREVSTPVHRIFRCQTWELIVACQLSCGHCTLSSPLPSPSPDESVI